MTNDMKELYISALKNGFNVSVKEISEGGSYTIELSSEHSKSTIILMPNDFINSFGDSLKPSLTKNFSQFFKRFQSGKSPQYGFRIVEKVGIGIINPRCINSFTNKGASK